MKSCIFFRWLTKEEVPCWKKLKPQQPNLMQMKKSYTQRYHNDSLLLQNLARKPVMSMARSWRYMAFALWASNSSQLLLHCYTNCLGMFMLYMLLVLMYISYRTLLSLIFNIFQTLGTNAPQQLHWKQFNSNANHRILLAAGFLRVIYFCLSTGFGNKYIYFGALGTLNILNSQSL